MYILGVGYYDGINFYTDHDRLDEALKTYAWRAEDSECWPPFAELRTAAGALVADGDALPQMAEKYLFWRSGDHQK